MELEIYESIDVFWQSWNLFSDLILSMPPSPALLNWYLHCCLLATTESYQNTDCHILKTD